MEIIDFSPCLRKSPLLAHIRSWVNNIQTFLRCSLTHTDLFVDMSFAAVLNFLEQFGKNDVCDSSISQHDHRTVFKHAALWPLLKLTRSLLSSIYIYYWRYTSTEIIPISLRFLLTCTAMSGCPNNPSWLRHSSHLYKNLHVSLWFGPCKKSSNIFIHWKIIPNNLRQEIKKSLNDAFIISQMLTEVIAIFEKNIIDSSP